MGELSYDEIRTLIAEERIEGSSLRVKFVCPQSGIVVEAQGALQQSQDLGGRLKGRMKQNLWYEIRRTISQFLASLLGGSFARRMAHDVASEVSRSGQQATRFSGADKEAAAVRAFQAVQSRFVKNPQTGQWMVAQ